MSGSRLAQGGLIDRSRTLAFQFDGKAYSGHPGDTLASALMASGVRVLGRSFKYHRPRGLWGAWFDDPNAILDVTLNGNQLTNCLATTTSLEDGMIARSVNAFPSAQNDFKGVLDRFHRFLPAGFYYKTFMWPNWHLFEPLIRKMAGLGQLDGQEIDGYQSQQTHDICDLLIVGGGPAGLRAAQVAADAGQDVVVIDDHPQMGGSAYQYGQIEGLSASEWVVATVQKIKQAGGRVLTQATAFGVYDHQMIAIAQVGAFGTAPKLIRMRPKRCLIATGAIDRPVTFANNDRPGVMSLAGAAEYASRYGVLAGSNIAVIAPHAIAAGHMQCLQKAGASLEIIERDIEYAQAHGGKTLHGLKVEGRHVKCDTVAVSAGMAPVVHLWRHAGGKLKWDDEFAAFVPDSGPAWLSVIGAAYGTFGIEDALSEAAAKAVSLVPPTRKFAYSAHPSVPQRGAKGRQWIDFQHDVTFKDIELAARENFVSVEHLKRYTTLGMASDQGKTSNIAGLGAMAAIQNKSVPETGTTTFRPPFVPVPLEIYRGAHRGQQFAPLKRLALEHQHREDGANLGEYGGWLRPGWYGDGPAEDCIKTEVLTARQIAGYFDASPLGKIEVMGPDAEAFVNFVYYNTIKTLRPGMIRYGFMLTEGGHVFDDGVVVRMDQNRFIISCSSSHVEGVVSALEGWRQDGNDPDRVFVHDTTQHWSTVTVTGPMARQIVSMLDLKIDLSPTEFPHMSLRVGSFQGTPVRVNRVSFTGDASFEISITSGQAAPLWEAIKTHGSNIGAVPIGLEALSILRAEKGYIVIGRDTDGETMPHDLGFGVPRLKKSMRFVGDRSLHTPSANDPNRKRLVGFSVPGGSEPLPNGGHITTSANGKRRSIGFISSSYASPTLNYPIALGLLDARFSQIGSEVEIYHLGNTRTATVTSPCFFDQDGGRLHAQ